MLLTPGSAFAYNPYTPDFTVTTQSGFSSEQTATVHPYGEIGFSFNTGGAKGCASSYLCLDLAINNATQTAGPSVVGVQSSRMVSAGFDIPGKLAGGVYLNSPPSFAGMQFSSYIANTYTAGIYDKSPQNPLNSRPGAFDTLNQSSPLPPFQSFDLCPGISSTCLSQGAPNSGLANGESTIVRVQFSYDGTTSVQDIINAFQAYYSVGVDTVNSHVAGRWKALDFCENVGGVIRCVTGESDKIGMGVDNPEPPIDPESVPGPLPILGAVSAFGYSRRLRLRLSLRRRSQISVVELKR